MKTEKIFCVLIVYLVLVVSVQAFSDNTIQSFDWEIDPDTYRNISQLISSKGYPVIEYEIQTPDGYFLGIQRIPYGIEKTGKNKSARPAVLLHHGLLTSGVEFVYDSPDQSLGFVLADSGYDVWIMNARGTVYSKKHVNLSPKSLKFWNFCWDELALVDLPTVIDHVLETTGQENLFYVGHSLGTTLIFALLSDKPEYNSKVRVAVTMAPVALPAHITLSPVLKWALRHLKEFELLMITLAHGKILPDILLQNKLRVKLCLADIQACYRVAESITGMDGTRFNLTRAPVYLASTPDAASLQILIHYGQTTPPEYVIENIKTPVALMWGLNDQTAAPVDVNLLALRLKNLVLNYQVPDPKWGHIDFAIAYDANKLVYQEILKLFKAH